MSTARRAARGRWRTLGLGGAALGVSLLAGWMVLGGTSGPPPARPLGAGLVPAALPRAGAPAEPEAVSAARRAEIVAEEARLAALRGARTQLEQEIAALRQQAEERRRDMPGRKVFPENAAAGPSAPLPPAAGGGGFAVPTATSQPAPAQPALAPAPPPAPEPLARGVRVFVHHRANSAPGAAAAEEVAQTLRGAGVEVPGVRAAPFVPSTPVVRYFHEEDQAAAARLAGRLGRGWAIQDFRAYLPQPSPQTLEVWLPGN